MEPTTQDRLHVFYVHSNLTIYLCAHYIQDQQLQPDEVIVIYKRVLAADVAALPGRKFFFNDKFDHLWLDKATYAEGYRKVQQFIAEEVRRPFTLVTLNLFYDTFQLLASAKLCRKIIYLEEGDSSYYTAEELSRVNPPKSLRYRLYRTILSKGRLYEKKHYPNTGKPEEVLCLHNDAFPMKNCKKNCYTIRDVFRTDRGKFAENYDHSVIFLVDHLLNRPQAQIDSYFRGTANVFRYIRETFGTEVLFKTHPELNKRPELVRDFFNLAVSSGLRPRIIYDPVELISTNFEDVRVVCHQSSLIRYCCYAGIKPIVWGREMVSPERRKEKSYLFRFMDENRDQIIFI